MVSNNNKNMYTQIHKYIYILYYTYSIQPLQSVKYFCTELFYLNNYYKL